MPAQDDTNSLHENLVNIDHCKKVETIRWLPNIYDCLMKSGWISGRVRQSTRGDLDNGLGLALVPVKLLLEVDLCVGGPTESTHRSFEFSAAQRTGRNDGRETQPFGDSKVALFRWVVVFNHHPTSLAHTEGLSVFSAALYLGAERPIFRALFFTNSGAKC